MWKIINVKWSHFCEALHMEEEDLSTTFCTNVPKHENSMFCLHRGWENGSWNSQSCGTFVAKGEVDGTRYCSNTMRGFFCEMQNLNHKTCEASIPLKQYLFFPHSLRTVHFCFTENDTTTHLNSMFITGFAYSQGNYILGNYIITQIIFQLIHKEVILIYLFTLIWKTVSSVFMISITIIY